jgi:hypothetical protein
MHVKDPTPKKAWRIVWCKICPPDDNGDRNSIAMCDRIKHRIYICRRTRGKTLELDCIIHELLHAFSWSLAENQVGKLAEKIARKLWNLGWRKTRKR